MPVAVVSSMCNPSAEFEGRITTYVVVSSIIAATAGLMFGYDIGISERERDLILELFLIDLVYTVHKGGVTAMDDFLLKFFPAVHRRKHEMKEDNYCKYNDYGLQLFTSSLYLAALLASFAASNTCRAHGRKAAMQLSSVFFLLGVSINAAASNLLMLILGRILLGLGVGFGNHAVPIFLSEIAPARIRGALNILFQLEVTIGILVANAVNYFAAGIHPYGWRLSLGPAGVPSVILFLGALLVTETPTSLIERGKLEEGILVLKKVRGTENVRGEYEGILRASEMARRVMRPFRELRERSSRPPLVIAVTLQFFQQFTGINTIMFYAPVMFQTIGFKSEASLLSGVITGGVNVLFTLVSIALVDKAGRRVLLLLACILMFITEMGFGGFVLVNLRAENSLEPRVAMWMVVLLCLYVMSFAWSWGPLGWLIPSEIFPLQIRTAGFACAVSSNMFFTFIIAQTFLSMLCCMKAGIFSFFAGWILIMTIFVVFFLPETKGVPMNEMSQGVWKQHWYWKQYMEDDHEYAKD